MAIPLTLWTIQPLAAVRHLEKHGKLQGDGRRISLTRHRAAFRWMIRQMELRVGPSQSRSNYPIWAWKAWAGQEAPRPDLRSRAHLPSGTRGARIEISVLQERVLLSDFDRWHAVLASLYLADDERDEELCECVDRQAIEQSWERIFELDRGDPLYHGPVVKRRIQATLWSIKIEDVRSIQWFTAR